MRTYLSRMRGLTMYASILPKPIDNRKLHVPSPQEKFFNRHVFIHTHVEKCGGSTLVRHLRTLLGDKHVFDARSCKPVKTKKNTRYPELSKHLSDTKLLSGHLWYGTPLAKVFPKTKWSNSIIPLEIFPYFRKKPLYIASVRHPVDRLESFFRYLRTRPGHNAYNEGIKNNNFDQFIDILISKNSPKIKNGICSQLTRCHDSPNLLEKAKKSFDHSYLAVVPYNKTHELANMLADVLQRPRVENRIVNPSAENEKATPSKATLAFLEKNCQDDIQLYSYILNNYQAKLIKAKQQLCHLIYKDHGK